MSKVRASRESVAYQDAYVREQDDWEKRRQLRVVHTRSRKRRAIRIQQILILGFVVLVASSMIYSQMVLTELTDTQSAKETELEQAQSEAVSLKAKLEQSVTISEVEDYAQNRLGLMKMDPSQVEYVDMSNPDQLTVKKDESSLRATFDQIAQNVQQMLEYLK